jgi:hypothetical protein
MASVRSSDDETLMSCKDGLRNYVFKELRKQGLPRPVTARGHREDAAELGSSPDDIIYNPEWRNGSRNPLKTGRLIACRFDSCLGDFQKTSLLFFKNC